jgi:hypothetical protein
MKISEMKWPRGRELLEIIRTDGNTVMLAFSRGKDALSCWLLLREAGFEIIPIHYYRVPGLEFVEESLRYYERYFGTRIHRLPHPSLYRMLRNFLFTPPSRISIVWEHELPRINYDILRRSLAEDLGMSEDTWIAVGCKASDSLRRHMTFARYGPIRRSQRTFHPAWDLSKADLLALLRRHHVKLPVEYRYFGRTFDGIDFRFLWGIKKHWPQDYKRIIDWFPLAQLEILRYERYQKRQKERD